MPTSSPQIRLFMSLTVFWAVCVGAMAQDSDPSHRKLKLPTGGNGNAQQQIQLIKQLQALMQNRSKPAGESEGLSDAQKSLMESMLEQFKDSKDLPKLSDIPPDLLGKVLADPKAREDAAEMLKKFQKERKLPEGNGQGDLPLPPRNRQASPNGSQNRIEPTDRRGSEGQPGSQTETPPNRDRTFDQNLDQRSPSSNSNTTPSRRPVSPNAGTPNNQPSPVDDNRPPTRLPNESDSDYEGRFMEFLEKQIRKQRMKQQGRDPNSLDIPAIPPATTDRPGTNRPSPRNGATERQPRRNSPQTSDGSSEPSPSISDLLKNLDGLPPVSDNSSALNPAEESARKQRQLEQQRARDAEQLQKSREKARQELDKGGLGSVLKKIVRDSKSELEKEAKSAKRRTPSGDGSSNKSESGSGLSGSLQDSIIRSLDVLGKDLVDIVKDGEFKKRDRKTQNRNSPAPSQTTPTAPRNPKPDGWSKKASDFFSEIAKPPPDDVAPEAGSSPDDNGSSGATNVSLTPFLVLGMVAVLALLLAWRSGAIDPEAILARNKTTSMPRRTLRTRKDVVEAFHQFATNSGRNIKSWWTHQQVKELVGEQEPAKQGHIEVLASVYERARYLPDEAVLADDQLHAAEAALDRCSS